MSTNVFDRVSSLVEEIGNEKQAAAKAAMDDPGGQDGASSHPSATSDSSELSQPAPEGAQSSDNESVVKEQTPLVPDNDPELTPEAAPTQDEVQLGQGVDKAKATGEDPSTEEDYKGDKEDPSEQGNKNMGGTDHPASGDIGEKYSSVTRESVESLSDAALFKLAAELGNDVNAVLANAFFDENKKAELAQPETHNDAASKSAAADVGYTAADESDAFAAAVMGETVKAAQHQADLVVDYIARLSGSLQKEAGGNPLEDMLGGEGEGEAHGTDEVPAPADDGGAAILAAMAGEGAPGGGGGMPLEGGAPEEMLAGGAPEEMLAGGAPEEALAGGGVPPELGGMDEEAAVQELAAALEELGIPPEALAAAAMQSGGGGMPPGGGGEMPPGGGMPPGGEAPAPELPPELAGAKLAAAVESHKRSGKYRITEAKQGTAKRKVRDYMKGYVSELVGRN